MTWFAEGSQDRCQHFFVNDWFLKECHGSGFEGLLLMNRRALAADKNNRYARQFGKTPKPLYHPETVHCTPPADGKLMSRTINSAWFCSTMLATVELLLLVTTANPSALSFVSKAFKTV